MFYKGIDRRRKDDIIMKEYTGMNIRHVMTIEGRIDV